jgi:hypothetical protein
MTQLEVLIVLGTKITPDGIAELKQALPGCKINPNDSLAPPHDPPGSVDRQRAVAEWVLSVGGTVRLTVPGKVAWGLYKPGTPLPGEAFALNQIDLEQARGVREEDMARLDQLPHLGILILPERASSDRGLARVGELPALTGLYLHERTVTDQGLSSATRHASLQALHVTGAGITDEGVKALENLGELQELNLFATRAGDDGLVSLKKLKGLKRLYLKGTQVSDAGVKHLQEMPQLETLDVADTQITRDGLAALRKALPRCKIYPEDNPSP